MGQAISSALTSKVQFQQEVNQMAFNGGLGLMGAGLGGMMLSRGAAGTKLGMMGGKFGKAGAAVAGLGALTSVAASTGVMDNMYDSILGKIGGVTSDTAFEAELAGQFNKPDTLIQRNDLMKNVLRAHGSLGSWNGGGDSFGHFTDAAGAASSRTGNALLDRLSTTSFMGADFQKLGLTGDALGEVMSGIGGSIRGKKGAQAEGLTRFAAGYGTAFGADPSVLIDMLSGAQAAGGNNLQSMVKNNMAAASDKNGQLDQFAVNVIAPAVGRVTQSLALKNVSQSAEKLNEQVSALYREFSVGKLSESNLGKVIANNPEMLGQLLGNFGSAAQQQAGTDVGFYQMMRMGLDPTEYARGAGSSPEKMKEFIEKSYAYFDVGSNMESDGKGGKRMNWNMFNALSQIGENFGFDRQQLEQLYVETDKNGGRLDIGDVSRLSQTAASVDKNATNNLSAITSTTLQQAQSNLTQQQDTFTATVGGISGKILDAQEIMRKYITDPDVVARATKGIEAIITEMQRLMGILGNDNDGDGKGDSPGQSAKSGVQAYLQNMPQEGRDLVKGMMAKRGIDWQDTTGGGAEKAAAYLDKYSAEIQRKVKLANETRVGAPPRKGDTVEAAYGTAYQAYTRAGGSFTGFSAFDANYKGFQAVADTNLKDGKDATLESIGVRTSDTVNASKILNAVQTGGSFNDMIDSVMAKVKNDPNIKSESVRKAATQTLSGIRAKLNDSNIPKGEKQLAVLEFLNLLGLGNSTAAAMMQDKLQSGITPFKDKNAEVLATREYQQLVNDPNSKYYNIQKGTTQSVTMDVDGQGYAVTVQIKRGATPQQLIDAIKAEIYKHEGK